MSEDEALDALSAAWIMMPYGGTRLGPSCARGVAVFLRDHPDVAQALGIGPESCVVKPGGQCHIRHSLPFPS